MNTKLRDALESFDHANLGEISAKTRRWYQSMLSSLVDTYGEMEVSAITADHLRDWRQSLIEREPPLSTHTIHGHLRAARRLFNWLVAEGAIESSPAGRLRLPKLNVGIPKAIAVADLQALLNHTARVSKRDFAIICFLADTGCRVGGLCGLALEDLYLDEGLAYLTEKGEKTRAVFFGHYTYAALVTYLAERADNNPAVFIGRKGPLQEHGVYQMLRMRAGEAGISGRFNPHSFRHAFAREFLRKGGNLPALGRILGHEPGSPVTARYYAVWANSELQEYHARYSPLSAAESLPKQIAEQSTYIQNEAKDANID